jgi:hypothetical protein
MTKNTCKVSLISLEAIEKSRHWHKANHVHSRLRFVGVENPDAADTPSLRSIFSWNPRYFLLFLTQL